MSTAGEERMAHREDELAILDTLHRYAHTIDDAPAKDWLDCFTDDGVWATRRDGQAAAGFPERRFQGRAALAELFASFEHALTKHVVMTPQIEVDGDRSVAHSYFMTPAVHPTGPFILAFGRFRDRLVRCPDGRWRFEERLCEVSGTHPLAEPLVGPDVSDSLVTEELKRLKARYCHLLDAKRWLDWAELFTEDGQLRLDPRDGDDAVSGRTAIVDRMQRVLADARTVHQVVMPDIEIDHLSDGAALGWDARQRMSPGATGPTKARASWGTFCITSVDVDGGTGTCERRWGRHDDDYARGPDGRWRIRSLRVTELHVEQS